MKVELRQIQMLELEIAKEFKRICEQNNIPYFLIGGTLLGAVRHKGFIPWDDDMDVGLMLEDYNRFIDCAKTQLDPRFLLQTWNDGDDYGYVYAKLKMKDTLAVETICTDLNMDKGVWLDIFPYGTYNEEIACSKKYGIQLKVLSRFLLIKKGYQLNKITKNSLSRLINGILKFGSFFVSRKYLQKKLENLLINKTNLRGEWVYQWDGTYTGRFVFPKQIFSELEEMQFEDEIFFVPKGYKRYLEIAYGDYMKLPPVEERGIGHSMEQVILNKPYEEYFKDESRRIS